MAAQDVTAPSLPIKVRGRYPPRVDLICEQCRIDFDAPPSQAWFRRFCSRACKGIAKTETAIRKRAALTFDDLWAMAMPEPNSNCLFWMGGLNKAGYGRYGQRQAHTLAYELAIGPIPEGKEPDHLCMVKSCIAPWHLEPVTHGENLRRSPTGILTRLGEMEAAKTHCPQGHPYDEENTFVRSRGSRECRTCMRERSRKYSQARKQERANV